MAISNLIACKIDSRTDLSRMINWSRVRWASGTQNCQQARFPVSDFSKWCPMRGPANLGRTSVVALTLFLLLMIGCGESSPRVSPEPIETSPGLATPDIISDDGVSPNRQVDSTKQTSLSNVVLLQNQGGEMEGHTPRGFAGMGTGLFAGDNLNPRFPNGDGVQLFLTFDLSTVPSGKVVSALLRSENASVRGMPLKDLGPLRAEEIRYSKFSPALWNLEPSAGGDDCEFATSSKGPFRCDLADAVRSSLNDSYPFAQFRLLLDRAGDNDGIQDLVTFFIADSNTNQPGIFEPEVTVETGN